MDLQILRFEFYKLACKSEKSIKEKHKFKTLSSYWAGSPTRGPRSHEAHPRAQPKTTARPVGGSRPRVWPLIGRARKAERETVGEERRRPELAVGGDSGEADDTITVSTQNCTGGPRGTRGEAAGGGSPSRMAARRGRGGAPRRRWSRNPTLDPRWAPPHYPDSNAPTSTRRGWPRDPGHGEPLRGWTPARHRGGENGNMTLPLLGRWRGADEGVEGFKAELSTGFEVRWCGGECVRARRSKAAMATRFLRPRLGESERKRQRREWRRMWRRGALETTTDLTGGLTAGVRPPRHVHAAATAWGQSATEGLKSSESKPNTTSDSRTLMPQIS
jgi:hypothetical protein